MFAYSEGNDMNIAGIPLSFTFDGNGFYLTALFQNVTIDGSPVVFHFDPPVNGMDNINAPALLLFLLAKLANGAIIG